jgi:hypothetical protein
MDGYLVMSGGQTGVDRAALDAALELGIPIGGYVPRGRMAEDGPIHPRYPLIEISGGYPERTKRNVEESDGTLIIQNSVRASRGTALTAFYAKRCGKPLFISTTFEDPDLAAEWICKRRIRRLNVAGPRESKVPGIYVKTKGFLTEVFWGVLNDRIVSRHDIPI